MGADATCSRAGRHFVALYKDAPAEHGPGRRAGSGATEWDFVWTGPDGIEVRTASCDLLEFRGDEVTRKNAVRKNRPV